ncbi:amino acid permease [Arthrobacter sp. E918]|uniref:Amino acid permease n=1 Tax=Arthrobacter mobilis TaxID=2724944 RepID=A0A7X6HBT3_9MICC|nr:amino acid permease [Arthrobacter mobilis]
MERRLGGVDATTIGIGSMVGAGVFVVYPPAAAAAGNWLLLSLAIAGLIAYCNASASAQLAAVYPTSGGTYVYGRERLGDWPGFLAGWAFVTGKIASCAAMALAFGLYVAPGYATPVAVAAVVLLTGINLLGITRTAWMTRWFISIVAAVLVFVIVVAFNEPPIVSGAAAVTVTPYGVLQGAALFFFAFAGYARIATMGEEIRDPKRLIPVAIGAALALTFTLYFLLGAGLLRFLGPELLATTPAPLHTVMERVGGGIGTGAVAVAAALACLGALLALIAGVSRTMLAMARERDLPHVLASVSRRFNVPWLAEVTVAAAVICLLLTQDVLAVVGLSSFGVLIYYAVTNASALTLTDRPWHLPKALNWLGLAGCLALAFTLPLPSVLAMAGVLAAGVIGRAVLKPSRLR